MAAISLEVAQAHLDTWLAAELEIAAGQSVSAFGRGLTRADLGTVRQQIQYWERKVLLLSQQAGTGRSRLQDLVIHG